MSESEEVVKVEGLDKLEADLARLQTELPKVMESARRAGAYLVASEMVRRAPIGNPISDDHAGDLARSVKFGETTKYAWVSVGSSRVLYAGPIVYGWSAHNITANPFPYEALDAREPEIFALHERGVAALVEEA